MKESFYNKPYFNRLRKFLDKEGLKYEIERNYFTSHGTKYRLMEVRIPSINIMVSCAGSSGEYVLVDGMGRIGDNGEIIKGTWMYPLKIRICSGEVYIGMAKARIEGNVYKVEDYGRHDHEIPREFFEFIDKIRLLGNNAVHFIDNLS